jgi:hypothetical protein
MMDAPTVSSAPYVGVVVVVVAVAVVVVANGDELYNDSKHQPTTAEHTFLQLLHGRLNENALVEQHVTLGPTYSRGRVLHDANLVSQFV